MIINTPISLGELLDKISILEIKRKKIKHKEKIFFIKKELILLKNILKKKFSKNRAISKYLEKLIKINLKLWSIEDNLRQCEKKSKFDKKFVQLARSVYFTNDKRAKIKLEINEKFGSKIVEVKSYQKY